jgi:fatty acid desaturase
MKKEIIIGEYHIVDELENAIRHSRLDTPKDLLIKPSLNKLIIHALMDWSVVIACWIAIYFLPVWSCVFISLIIASRFHSFGVILHDVVHMPLKNKTAKIRLLEIMTGYPIASTLNAMRYHHLRHHKDSCMVTDPYFKRSPSNNPIITCLVFLKYSILIPFWTIRGLYGSLAFYIPAMRKNYARVFLQDKSGLDLTESKEVIQCAKEDQFQLLFYFFVFSILFVFFSVKIILFCYLFPIAITGLVSGYRVAKEHHLVEVNDRKMETIVKTTVDHNLGGVLQFFLAPRNIGYHIVHHLHPQVAWYQLPKLRNWYLKNHPNLYPREK